jgi:peptide/nickel transport system substrate-binding protein
MGIVFLNLNHPEKDFFADRRVRQALLLSINRQWLIDEALDGQAIIAEGPIMPNTWAFTDDLVRIPYDPTLAEEYLTTSGWELPVGADQGSPDHIRIKDEQSLAFELAYPNDPQFARVAEILQTSWERVGVAVDLIPVEHSTLLEEYLQARDYQAVLTELNLTQTPDPDPYPFWHDTQIDTGQNYGGFSDRNISIWLERARTIPDISHRTSLLHTDTSSTASRTKFLRCFSTTQSIITLWMSKYWALVFLHLSIQAIDSPTYQVGSCLQDAMSLHCRIKIKITNVLVMAWYNLCRFPVL